jgi:hypothetical protein
MHRLSALERRNIEAKVVVLFFARERDDDGIPVLPAGTFVREKSIEIK